MRASFMMTFLDQAAVTLLGSTQTQRGNWQKVYPPIGQRTRHRPDPASSAPRERQTPVLQSIR
jgi:hypothetical protein